MSTLKINETTIKTKTYCDPYNNHCENKACRVCLVLRIKKKIIFKANGAESSSVCCARKREHSMFNKWEKHRNRYVANKPNRSNIKKARIVQLKYMSDNILMYRYVYVYAVIILT